MQDPYLRERATDIRDLGQRILIHLQQDQPHNLDYPSQTILVGEEISAMQLAEVPTDRLMGIVSASGSGSSHVAILARALGVPAVMGVAAMPVAGMQGQTLIVDGHRGSVYIQPTPTVCEEYQQLIDQEQTLNTAVEAMRGLAAETTDGLPIALYVNIGLINKLNKPQQADAMGVGLYRTELPFMIRDRFPSEAEQMTSYQQVLATFAPLPVTLRTLDVGGDKPLPYFPFQEQNPFLGWRGVRISLQHPEIFLTQIRAMLRASQGYDNLRIMLPMVTHVSEVDELIQLIHQAHTELQQEGYTLPFPPIGVMIEVPSAVYQVKALAQRVDFISVGTNDLAQYLLAVDRNNPRVAELYDDLHPAVLQALQQIVAGAQQYQKPVSICGELAGNPLATVLLIGLGIDSLSMSAGSLLKVKWVIRHFSTDQARRLLKQAVQQDNAIQVRQLLYTALDQQGLGELVPMSAR
jgi:phosphotransferase system enzyme I (PtsP)